MKTIRQQAGYLYEIPLLVILAGVLYGVFAPILGEPWSFLLLGGLVLAWLLFILYNRFAAGWQPGRNTPSPHFGQRGKP